jgi:predicted dehydrogenase
VEDLATAMIRMEDGSTLTLDVSWAVHMETDSAPYIHLMGSEGGVSLRGQEGKLLTEKDDQLIDVPLEVPADDEGARLRMSRHFLECIRDGREPIIPVMSGYTTNLILDAIYRSSQLGREIELDWDLE